MYVAFCSAEGACDLVATPIFMIRQLKRLGFDGSIFGLLDPRLRP